MMPTCAGLQFPSSVGFSLPLSLTHGHVARWQFVQHPQQHAQGVFSDRVPVAFRTVVHRDAQFFGQAVSMFSNPDPLRAIHVNSGNAWSTSASRRMRLRKRAMDGPNRS